ncbi:MAG: cysteine desulfurase [Clostridiales bacterium]|jgi:cysteine desulfurase|nr:cysteine desulfurase [Clostridiales bacterium]
MIYLDNAATTRPTQEVADAVARAMLDCYGNPSSAHALGVEAARALDGARRAIAGVLRAPRDRVFFAASGSEANNMAIFGACPPGARRPGRIVTTRAEHASVLNAVRELEGRGWQADYAGVDSLGRVDLAMLESAIGEDTALIALSHVNSETGAAQPIEAIGRIRDRRNPGAALFFDCVQSFCKLELLPERLGADMVSFSAHKIHGPKGVAALYARGGLRLRPLVHGGGQEAGLRSGTENTPGICGFAAAASALAPRIGENAAKAARLKARLLEGLDGSGLEYCRVSPPDGSPYILCVAFAGVRAEVLLRSLSAEGVCVSAGSACSSRHRSRRGSSALNAMGLSREVIEGALRFSFSPFSEAGEVDEALDRLRAIVPTLRAKR